MTQRLALCVDGRFLAQPLTGVQRYAREWIETLDALLEAGDPATVGVDAELVVPRALVATTPALRRIRVRRGGFGGGHAWEQLSLPLLVGGAILFCPANLAPLASLATGRPVVVTLHGLSFLERPDSYGPAFRIAYRILTSTALRRADAVLTVSESERRALVERCPRASERIHVIPNGASPGAFRRRAGRPSSERRDLLFVGSLTEGKNLDAAIAALAIVRERHDLGLVVVGGTGPGLASARIRIPASCEGRVEFVGQIEEPERLQEFYERARCLVFPSRYESSGLPPTEAMACGCPVVASDLPALRERCGEAALYAHPDRADEFARRILEVIESPARTDELRSAGLQRAAELSWDANVRRSLEVMRSVAARRLRS